MDVLREHLARSLRGGQAFVSYKKALEGVKPELRGVRPNPAIHSIYEELEHMRRAQMDLINYALDSDWEPPDWPEGYWPERIEAVPDDVWDATVKGFFKDMEKAVKLVNNPKIDVLGVVAGATEYTYLREIMIVIEHNAYHLGKILDIRKALGNWK